MLETSIATIGILVGSGFSLVNPVVGFRVVCFFGFWWKDVEFSCVSFTGFMCFKDRMLISMKSRGSCRFSSGSGKLYFGVVVIGYCAFTKIHQHLLFGPSWYLNIAHVQFAQYNNKMWQKIMQ